MTENLYYPEKQVPEISPPEKQAIEANIDQAAPVSDKVAPSAVSGDQAEMQSELASKSYAPATEMEASINKAEPAAAVNKLEAPRPAEQTTEAPPIEVKGFEKSGVMTNEDVKTYLKDTLPADHVRGDHIAGIHYQDEYRGVGDKYIAGNCSTGEVSRINIFKQTPDGSFDRDEMEDTLTHEVGHNVRNNLTPEQQQQWDTISSSSKTGEYVDDYAKTNTHEDFAQSYAYYVREPETLTLKSPAKFSFMKDVVFKGRQYAA